ncbi:hypothetical protein RRG08_003645 [Elysia crispata]|uniref:Uncharacterized protein n=1 Tax=Elysia crispata TaxID=231223 RepID=A0AAE1AV52_9GAST|nr:hypothetical protein RRG08_003645 [Elysia crispata]
MLNDRWSPHQVVGPGSSRETLACESAVTKALFLQLVDPGLAQGHEDHVIKSLEAALDDTSQISNVPRLQAAPEATDLETS